MALPKTVGNWTFSAENSPTSSSTKQITLDVPDWSTDYSVQTKPVFPNESIDTADETLYYGDISNGAVLPTAQLALGKKSVRSIYGNSTIPTINRLPSQAGVRALENYVKTYKVVNSVSGDEMEFQCKATSSITVPSWATVPKEVLEDFLLEYCSFLLASASNPSEYLLSILRGDLDLR